MFNIIKEVTQAPNVPTVVQYGTLGTLLGAMINIAMGIGFGMAIVSLAWAFYQYTISQGDPKATQQAWGTFVWGCISLGVAFGLVIFKTVLVKLLGVGDSNMTNALPNF